ncbi:MAG: LysR family transcriptional regulator [Pseudomonadota bacterium]
MMPRATHQTLRRLTYFAAIAEAGSIRGGAEKLGRSVPVLSAILAELEAELGVTLANRSTRVFTLTPAGKTVHAIARDILDTAETAFQFHQSRELTGRVKVTLPVELAVHWLPDRLQRFSAEFPKIVCDVDARDQLIDLAGTDIDLAIRAHHQRPDPARHEAPNLPLALVAASRPEIAPTGDGSMAIETALLGAPGGSKITAADTRSKRLVMLEFDRAIAVNSRETAIGLARKGLGTVLATRLAVEDDLERQTLIEICPDLAFGGLSLRASFRDARPTPAAKAFAADLLNPDDLNQDDPM